MGRWSHSGGLILSAQQVCGVHWAGFCQAREGVWPHVGRHPSGASQPPSGFRWDSAQAVADCFLLGSCPPLENQLSHVEVGTNQIDFAS